MYFSDGTIYEGEWYDDERNGQGMIRLSKFNLYSYRLYRIKSMMMKEVDKE